MIRKEECKHKQSIQYQSFAPQCQDCGVYMVTRKRNPLSSKSFFDFSEEEQKEILNQAADDSNKAQQELMQTEEQVCTCGMEPCDPKCKACPLFHVHTPPLDKPFNIEKFKKDASKVRATFDTEAVYGKSERDIYLDIVTELLYKQPKKTIRKILDLNFAESSDIEEGYYDSNMHWHIGKPPTKGNTPEIPDSSEAWEERFDNDIYIPHEASCIGSQSIKDICDCEAPNSRKEVKNFIHTLLKHKESLILQTVREKVLKLPNMAISPTTGEKIMVNLDDVLKLIEE